jgi:hypothetical protein
MASNMAGVLAPMAAGRAVGMPVVRAAQEGLLGLSMTPEAAVLRQFAGDEFGGIRAYHGSPHSFDKFSMDAIGTGEGAQAYGHGLYFAEDEGIAGIYRDFLSDKHGKEKLYRIDGQEINKMSPLWPAADIAAQMKKHNIDPATPDGMDWLASETVARSMSGANDVTSEDVARMLGKDVAEIPKGSMYEVNINADPADFLDWDKPLSEQPQVAQRLGYSNMNADDIHNEALRIMEAQPNGAWMNDPASKARVDELQDMLDRKAPAQTGAEYYQGGNDGDVSNILSQMGYGNPQEASAALRGKGIPGIKYLDAGSRSTGGTSNFVIFDENLIDIVRKYGIAGAAAMLGASQADVAQAMQQQRPQGLLSGPQ